ncbi:MAG: hypothetical protein EXX96DRAFT_455095, partial [Benjaminiella poitrasii]
FIKTNLITRIDLCFPNRNIDHSKILVLYACVSSKLSLHVIHRNVAFMNNIICYVAYVAEYS